MAAARPDPPAGLGEHGAELWRSVLADLPDNVELDAVEVRALESACQCRDDVARLEAAIAADGPTVIGSRGNVRPHPGYDLVVRLRALEARLLSKIELDAPAAITPATARSKRAAELRHTRRRRAGQV